MLQCKLQICPQVQSLMALGFSRILSERAFEDAGKNLERAASMLLDGAVKLTTREQDSPGVVSLSNSSSSAGTATPTPSWKAVAKRAARKRKASTPAKPKKKAKRPRREEGDAASALNLLKEQRRAVAGKLPYAQCDRTAAGEVR